MPYPRSSNLINTFDALLAPPFKGAPIVVWICFVLFFTLNKTSGLWQGNLLDPDDYLYLVQAIDALKGHAWFDWFQHRMNPPDGTLVHYSHILSGFYAGFVILLQPFFGIVTAAIITAAIIPPLYFAVFLFSMRRIAQIMVDKKWGDLTAYFLFFSPSLLSQFMPGHIDHHGLVILLAIVAFGCIARMIMQPSSYREAIIAGAMLAFGLVLGLELIAVLCLLMITIGVWAMAEGGIAARNGAVFAGSLFVFSTAFLCVTRSPVHFFDADILTYSIVYVIMTGCFALCFLGVALAAQTVSVWPRFIIGGCLAFMTGILFLHYFPALKGGPYGAMDSALAKLIFTAAPEAWPIMRPNASWNKTIMPMLMPLMAVGAGAFMMAHTKNRAQRWLWGIISFLVLVTAGLAAFYQSRFLYFAQAFSALPLTAMIWHDRTQRPATIRGRQFVPTVRVAVLLLIGPISVTLAGNYSDDFSDNPVTTLSSNQAAGCDMHALEKLLDDPQSYGNHPRLIINTLNEGPELLFRTPHTVLAGPYHTNITGNMDAMNFFTARDANEAKAIAMRRGAELVVLCNMPLQMLIYKAVSENKSKNIPVFSQQLINGAIPDWLKLIQVPSPNNLMLFEIRLPAR